MLKYMGPNLIILFRYSSIVRAVLVCDVKCYLNAMNAVHRYHPTRTKQQSKGKHHFISTFYFVACYWSIVFIKTVERGMMSAEGRFWWSVDNRMKSDIREQLGHLFYVAPSEGEVWVDIESDGQTLSLVLREWKEYKVEIWRKEDAKHEERESTSSHFEFDMICRPDIHACERNVWSLRISSCKRGFGKTDISRLDT